MKDFIISGKSGEVYAEVELHKDETIEYFYIAHIVKDSFPDVVVQLIVEHDELVRGFSMILLDDVEEKLYEYDMRLQGLNKKIFSPCFKMDKIITSYTKYPTGNGFMDDY
ncbi:hypothetical protein [Massilia antarctica]|uniref:hypothetical protein n=1 Tax=Massilia antarctica TaxID=2765360 RepID=UPI0006BB864A|nr:hypothetical protein [Massilia sp. H27-R4]MCY0910639.1 hypothetical protein [Massilia sp. H27-R4]